MTRPFVRQRYSAGLWVRDVDGRYRRVCLVNACSKRQAHVNKRRTADVRGRKFHNREEMNMTTFGVRAASIAGSIFGLALAGSAGIAHAADFTLKYGVLTINDTQHYFANAVKEEVEKATKGRVEVKVFPRGQLGSPSAHIQGLQLGTIEAFQAPIDFFAGVDPRAGVFSIPFMFKSRQQTTKAVQDPAIFDEAVTLLEGNGIVGVMMGSQADGKYIAREPLRKLSDFNGKKMRVNATDAERERMKRLGATAIPMGLAEMVTSLQSGVIDGTMSGISIHVNFNLDTISKVLLVTNDTMLVSYAALSKKWLDTLPADLRKTVVDTIRGMKPTFGKLSDQEDANLTKKWLDRGGSFIKWSDADTAEFHKRVGSVGQDVTAKNPALNAYYKKVKAIADKHN
jgi:C4-dicarboxylate-binding protein DctP